MKGIIMKIKNTFLLFALYSSLSLNAVELEKEPRNPEEPATGKIIKSVVTMETIMAPLIAFASNPGLIAGPGLLTATLTGAISGSVDGIIFAAVGRSFGKKNKLTAQEVIKPLKIMLGVGGAISFVDLVLNPIVAINAHEYGTSTNPAITSTSESTIAITYKDSAGKVLRSTNGTKIYGSWYLQERALYASHLKALMALSLAGYFIYKRLAISAENRKKEKELIAKTVITQPLCA